MKTIEHSELRRVRRAKEYWQLVSATAEYRYRACWDNARQIMTDRGFDPARTIQATCDQGADVNATFILPDGRTVSCDFREDRSTRQIVGIGEWKTIHYDAEIEDEYSLGAEILKDPRLCEAFDRAVLAYFDFHLRHEQRT